MPAVTFLALLNEGAKLDVYDKKFALTVSAYPNMEKEDQARVREALRLPDDVLGDILDDEKVDDTHKIKDILNGN